MTTKRITSLTDDQRARFDEWADRWIEIGLRTGPADRERMEAALEKAYGYAGLPWHGRVVWVPSPMVMAIAAPTAAFLLELARTGAVRGAVDGAVGDAVDGAVGGAVGDAVDDAVDDAVRGAVRGAVGGAVDDAVRGAVGGAVGDAVDDAVRGAVRGAVDGAVRGAVGDAVRGAVDDAVGDAVDGADPRADLIYRTVLQAIGLGWYRYMGGQLWVGGWGWGGAWTSFFREVAGLELDGDLWDRALTYEATLESACWWWPHRDFVMVCERPTEIHRELTDPNVTRGWGSHRLHRDDGPAVVWPDGWGVYALHGVRVPRDLVEDGWDLDRVLREENQEVRRVAVERIGWESFVEQAGLSLVHEDDDPANHGRRLRLFEVPEQIFGEPIRVLLCTNGTPERDGTLRRFGLTVPAAIDDAVAAAAWTYQLDKTEYAALERRT